VKQVMSRRRMRGVGSDLLDIRGGMVSHTAQ